MSEYSERLQTFIDANKDLTLEPENGAPLLITEDENGRLHVAIEMGEDTTSRQVRASVPLLAMWRDRLLDFQGPALDNPDTRLLEIYTRAIDRGLITCGEIAERHNRMIAQHLQTWFADLANNRAASKALTILILWGMREHMARATLQLALQEMHAGHEPFAPGEPITAERVRNKINSWRRTKKRRALVARLDRAKRVTPNS